MSFEYKPRELRSATELRALSHPLRARLLEMLMTEGELTATQCAERTGESPANCSWHLRQLAKYAFVEEAGGGTGRQRPWRAVTSSIEWGGDPTEPEFAAASEALEEVWLDHQIGSFQAYLSRRADESPAWRAASMMGQSLAWLTLDELTEIGRECAELFVRYVDRIDPATRPDAARLVRLVVLGFPDRAPLDDDTSVASTDQLPSES